jgi:hypothetical protein
MIGIIRKVQHPQVIVSENNKYSATQSSQEKPQEPKLDLTSEMN